MNQKVTEIVFILDRSGSMNGFENDTIGGFNGFVKKQAELGQTNLTTVLFDDRYEILHNGIDAKKAVLTAHEYFTRGNTALLDAVGKTIDDVGKRLSDTPEARRPGKVIFVITTDGLENASRLYSHEQIRNMITHQRENYKWEFIFMGANIDVVREGEKMGISVNRSISFGRSETGIAKMYSNAAGLCAFIRNGA